MSLDDRARTATESLLADTRPDTGARLADLKRIRRNRSLFRTVAAGAVLAAVVGGWLVLADGDDGKPEPAQPTYRNGALLIAGSDIRVADGGHERIVLPKDYSDEGDIAFTADGSQLFYLNTEHQVAAIDLETGETRELVPCPVIGSCLVAPSPDGRWLAHEVGSELRLREVGGDDDKVLQTPGVAVGGVAWSPDGETLALSSPEGIYTMSVSGSEPRPLVEFDGVTHFVGRVQWSPDGRTIAFLEARVKEAPDLPGTPVYWLRLRLVDPDGGDLRTLQEVGECGCAEAPPPDFAWAPDGSGIAAIWLKVSRGHSGRTVSDGIYVVGLDGHRRLVASGPTGTLAWQPIPED